MLRDRSYQDLSEDEKKRYDRLRKLEKRLAHRNGKSRPPKYIRIKAAADKMLGLRPGGSDWINDWIVRDTSVKSIWRGSATHYAGPQSRG